MGELARRTGLSQPAASQHLKVLRDAGLVRGRVDRRLRADLDSLWEPALLALKRATEASDRA